MKLSEAIEILDLNVEKAGKQMPPDTLQALKLGIEALERIQTARTYPGRLKTYTLPSETPEPPSSDSLASLEKRE